MNALLKPAPVGASGYPSALGLYNPRFEHDSCGVGMVCHLKGVRSHEIVADGLQILTHLSHRGAYGCDATTGDGAGILMQMPHVFLKKACRQVGFELPAEGEYACGAIFLPPQEDQRTQLIEMCAEVVRNEGQQVLGCRPVPVRSEHLGDIARSMEPVIFQLFIGRGDNVQNREQFERKLYVIRKTMTRRAQGSELSQRHFFHVPSLSSRTLVYKGMFLAHQIGPYYPDLTDPELTSAVAVVHQRYSTNTFPSWDLAHPFRFLCHNGEINTVRGNINWIRARQHLFSSDRFGDDLAKLLPIVTDGASDSATLDNALELLYHTGRPLAHCMMMLIPEAWQNHATMSDARKSFYAYHSCLMEPWDGPASIVFTDGIQVGAVLDRNGLRPARYTVTSDDRVIMGSEAGVIDVAADMVLQKGRLQPGRMFLIDMQQGRIIGDDEIKDTLAAQKPYGQWVADHLVSLADLPAAAPAEDLSEDTLQTLQRAVGFSLEDFKFLIGPMARDGKEPTGSMGDDTPPAVLSEKPRPLFDYFRQLFAQVTNPPLDAIREALVTSLATTIGAEGNLFDESPLHCRQLKLRQPVLTPADMARIRHCQQPGLRSKVVSTLYPVSPDGPALAQTLEALCDQAAQAVDQGDTLLILSDQGISEQMAAIPVLLATAAVHHHLIRKGLRTRCGLVVESAEVREIHHFCCLIGYGAGAVHPYLALASIGQMIATGQLADTSLADAVQNYIQSVGKGILKVLSKMGISTLQSYRGAQIFECIGIEKDVVERYFSGTASRIGGADLNRIARQTADLHASAYPHLKITSNPPLPAGGKYQWRRDGEAHQYNPMTIAKLQQAVRRSDANAWREYQGLVDKQNADGALIRGLLQITPVADPVPIEEVEPWTNIVQRFKTGAMSYGSISKEAHEALAIAMNRIGGKSNSGEGGEDADRFVRDDSGNFRNSAIKQVASGRFGVTAHYLVNAAELQIKMAQGAKPGEGGQLPGFKVYPWIAKTRHSTPYVGLISPPPHHDIYSIEDLAQLIFDLKNINPEARVSVKLVSELGVGTVAAGVVKGKADVVLISGESGGTGASPLSSIKYAGLPWELGLAETHQTLTLNGLRHKIVVECDGQLKTGRDVAIAALLGADEFGFGTIALVCLGCVMMRVCHLNTCPVGIATQDPDLRKKFTGRPEHVVQFMRFVAEDLRQIMAGLGFRSVDEMVGRSDCLDFAPAIDQWKTNGLDLSAILHRPEPPAAIARYCAAPAETGIGQVLDLELIAQCRPALEKKQPVQLEIDVRNIHRTLGTRLSGEIAQRHGAAGLPDETISIVCRGSAGQSFFAFGARGIHVTLWGEANDYFGKGLSGATLVARPPQRARFAAAENIIIGNVAFYGATDGKAFISGLAGERFCVRNSGVVAVVEGVGDHGCEYMTGGCVVVLGPVGRNFAAGMSGGIAYVYDPDGSFARQRCNLEMVELEPMADENDCQQLHHLVEDHYRWTQSLLAQKLLDQWPAALSAFVKVIPVEYRRALKQLAAAENR